MEEKLGAYSKRAGGWKADLISVNVDCGANTPDPENGSRLDLDLERDVKNINDIVARLDNGYGRC